MKVKSIVCAYFMWYVNSRDRHIYDEIRQKSERRNNPSGEMTEDLYDIRIDYLSNRFSTQ